MHAGLGQGGIIGIILHQIKLVKDKTAATGNRITNDEYRCLSTRVEQLTARLMQADFRNPRLVKWYRHWVFMGRLNQKPSSSSTFIPWREVFVVEMVCKYYKPY